MIEIDLGVPKSVIATTVDHAIRFSENPVSPSLSDCPLP